MELLPAEREFEGRTAFVLGGLAAFLASPRSGFCTGAQFTADSGLLAGLRIF
jgi:meso-butanediol dehydrogenase / (S,S)-butanediol dehydrogenase / diacetyl reductase